jgi:protein-L-isoaspartate(D-aspartate) O-methyltransferase
MVESQIIARGIRDLRVVRAFATVAREAFVPESLAAQSYADRPLDIGDGQTISQPYIVARTLAALELTGEERVLEVGTGSGYAAALLGCIAREVRTIERIDRLARSAAARLAAIGAANVHVHVGDGTLGWLECAPYEAIAVAAGGPVVPHTLLDQLVVGGRIVMPVLAATGEGQMLVLVRRVAQDAFERTELERVRFVPLIGALGYAS